MAEISKAKLVELSDAKLADAKFLLAAGRGDNAYYLAGYAVELMLKGDPVWSFQGRHTS